MPYIKGLQHGLQSVFKSDTTLRSHLMWPKDAVHSQKQDRVVYKIPFECRNKGTHWRNRKMHTWTDWGASHAGVYSFHKLKPQPSMNMPRRPCIISSFENEALENEDQSTKHPNLENEAPNENKALENEAPKSWKRSTQKRRTRKRRPQKLENEDP